MPQQFGFISEGCSVIITELGDRSVISEGCQGALCARDVKTTECAPWGDVGPWKPWLPGLHGGAIRAGEGLVREGEWLWAG